MHEMQDEETGIVPDLPLHAGRDRFQAAVRKVEMGKRMRRMSQAIDAVDSAPADRMAAAVQLEIDISHQDADTRPALRKALQKKKDGVFDSTADRVVTEIYVGGSLAFHMLTPKKLGNHRRWLTWLVMLVIVVLFFYQAGVFPAYLAASGAIGQQCLQEAHVTNAFGLWRWIVPRDFCFGHTFSGDFLVRWGALWLPQLRSAPWRIWTSLFIHQTFWHMATNMLMWVTLAAYVERVFGWWRLAILTLTAGTGGALMTASFDDRCIANVGFSGCDFGLLGVYIVDLVENIRTSKMAVLRSVVVVALLILLIVGSATAPDVSQWAHLGGFLSGVAPSMVLLPRLGHAHVEAWVPIVGAMWTLVYFTSLLCYVFADRAKGLDCGTADG